METWVLYAIISLIFAGLFNFGMKMISQRNYDTSFVSMIGYVSASICGVSYYLYLNGGVSIYQGFGWLILFAVIERVLFFSSTLARVESLNNIDTTLFFPLYKTLFPVLMTIVSYFYIGESLTLKEFVGIGLGIMVPLFLITKKENSVQKNLKKGIFFVGIVSVLTTSSTLVAKYISMSGYDLNLFLCFSFLCGIGVGYLSHRIVKNKSKKVYSKKGIYIFGLVLGIIQFLTVFFFIHALEGNLAIVVTINSFSILIPIILSVIFYKEEMTKKKAFVIFLSIVSVILFI